MFADDVIKLVEYFREDNDEYFYLGKRIDVLAQEIDDLSTSVRTLLGELHEYQNKDNIDYDISKDVLPF